MSTHLTLAEAVPLAQVLVDSVARGVGVRVLAIKGPALGKQGLRAGTSSVDVDVLVDPKGFALLLNAMLELGWTDREPHHLPTVMPRHSSTLRHPTWPCEVDLHHYFPGFLESPQVVFDVLWDHRARVMLAGQLVTCPNPQAHSMIAALHYLRDAKSPTSTQRLDALVAILRSWPRDERETLVELGLATGAEATLAPLYEAMGLNAPATVDRPGLADWRLRSESETTAALAWWIDLQRAPWRQKPVRVKRAVWPSADQMRLFAGQAVTSRQELRQMRWARLRRGMAQLPRAVRESRRMPTRGSVDLD